MRRISAGPGEIGNRRQACRALRLECLCMTHKRLLTPSIEPHDLVGLAGTGTSMMSATQYWDLDLASLIERPLLSLRVAGAFCLQLAV